MYNMIHLLRLCVGVVYTELKAGDLPATDVVDEDRLGTDVAVNEMYAAVKKAEAFNDLQPQYSPYINHSRPVTLNGQSTRSMQALGICHRR